MKTLDLDGARRHRAPGSKWSVPQLELLASLMPTKPSLARHVLYNAWLHAAGRWKPGYARSPLKEFFDGDSE